ncbi:MAG: hypothetical protein HQL27_03565 [Candidatus Omnitrophica bacterium]|nr:hypothetical protein [Candidatus Omnitrophota bacterium]
MGFPKERIKFVEHHLCHAGACYYGLPVPKNEKVLVLTIDGSGDELCSTVSVATEGALKRIAQTEKGNSLGNIYSRVAFMLGFIPWEHEHKLMGMAPYASFAGTEKAYGVFRKYLALSSDNGLLFKRKIPESTVLIYPRLRKDTELLRFDWICAGLQRLTEELLAEWVRNCIKKTGIRKIALSGGVAMNVKANKRISEIEGLEELYIMPSCGDETNSFGAAYNQYYENFRKPPLGFQDLYLGNDLNDDDAKKAIGDAIKENKTFKSEYYKDIEAKVAELLAEGKVVARVKGRLEFGARALGNRSILADPSKLSLVREINLMVKKRDFWMPFAPVTTKKNSSEYIVNPKNIDSPYMMMSYDTTHKREEFIAAVHQADHTARFQLIEESQNPGYFRVLKEFEKLTSRKVLLNTSFNLHGYPIVGGAKEALWVFFNSELKFMALGNFLVFK